MLSFSTPKSKQWKYPTTGKVRPTLSSLLLMEAKEVYGEYLKNLGFNERNVKTLLMEWQDIRATGISFLNI